jgi:hypothetical protein
VLPHSGPDSAGEQHAFTLLYELLIPRGFRPPPSRAAIAAVRAESRTEGAAPH